MSEPDRVAEITENLSLVRRRVERACVAADRDPDSVCVIAVTKTRPAEDVRAAVRAGLVDVGENRAAELAEKAEYCAGHGLVAPEVRWHFIGQLQTNKARLVARWADVVHSVDRTRLARVLAERARENEREITALVQVNLDPDAVVGTLGPRGGCHPQDVAAVADFVAEREGLRLGGIMAVAPPPDAGVPVGESFARLRELGVRLRADHPAATMVSAGMSADLEAAVEHGATHLRIGTALLGDRPSGGVMSL
ncbi:YggS family pyridoxal phosphate-dependent enzyme [Spiractinospora alimapuensis]|uniref:YggS family pyridoxal phosphate-dependent enzyme n=1 Tax=Spiractinospora alimapuensis TaxID=2820884 RepID=UPI001EEC4BCD|nr:YggS family pyridoxal phosphate-dependent enzyme [Spiractinospora alimapuensis]QVQ53128.1 YggS family pyridoxal phosphate-dependent enzyme [Spiractinospora alimapuensis]